MTQKLRRFVRERPGTSLAIVAGVTALGGAEWAAGALLGGAVMSVVARRSGPELRARLRERARRFIRRAEEIAEQPPEQPPEQPHVH